MSRFLSSSTSFPRLVCSEQCWKGRGTKGRDSGVEPAVELIGNVLQAVMRLLEHLETYPPTVDSLQDSASEGSRQSAVAGYIG